MSAPDEARQLLARAYKDWRAADGMADPNVFADEVFGFHVQQAAEKALKAWLALLDVEYPRSHDLSRLLGILRDHGQDVDAFDDLIEFNAYAVQYRYEAFEDIGVPLDRTSVSARVQRLLHDVEWMIEAFEKG